MRRGFTLIEVIISIAVMTIIFIPVLSLFSSSRVSLKYSDDLGGELSAARSAMELYDAKDYETLHLLLNILHSRRELSSPSLYCFIEYPDVPHLSGFLESFDSMHCTIYEDVNDYIGIKKLTSIKYDTVLKINFYETSDALTSTKAITVVVTAWSSLRGSPSRMRLVCMKGACT